MSSRLASLLVSENHVSATAMADAFQRQVLFGGALDTIVLEMGLVDEGTLGLVLSMAAGLPPVDEIPEGDLSKLGRHLPPTLADRYHAVPVAYKDGTLTVVVPDPPDRAQLERLATLLGMRLDARVGLEFQVHVAQHRVYGTPLPSRTETLLGRLKPKKAAPRPTRREASGNIFAPARTTGTRAAVVAPVHADEGTARVSLSVDTAERTQPHPVAAAGGEIEARRERDDPTLLPPPRRIPDVIGDATVPTAVPPEMTPAVATGPVPQITPTESTQKIAPPPTEPEPEPPKAVEPEPKPVTPPSVTATRPARATTPASLQFATRRAPRETPSSDVPVLELEEGLRLLDEAPDRDSIFETLCRIARSRFGFAVVFAVHNDKATAHIGLARRWLERTDLAKIDVPLDQPSEMKAAIDGRSPFLGQIGTRAALAKAMALLGRPAPLWGALVPLVLRERTVAVLYADAGGRVSDNVRVAELAQAATEAAVALQRLILRSKGAPDPNRAPRPTLPGVGPELLRATSVPALATAAGGVITTALHDLETAPLPVARADGMAINSSPPAIPDHLSPLLDEVANEGPAAPGAAMELLKAGEVAARSLVERLPGPLKGKRFTLSSPLGSLVEIGPLVGLAPRFGRLIVAPLVARLADADVDVRLYATLCFAELPHPDAVGPLGNRLFDADATVRRAAALVLGRFGPSSELMNLVERLRAELGSHDPGRRRQAVDALGELRDVPSVQRLIELVRERDELLVVSARRALLTITKQDFGSSRWKWRGWWESRRERSRLDWLLDGLDHADPAVRQSASDELEMITTELYGFHQSLSRPAREDARQKWLTWFKEHGDELAAARRNGSR